MSTEIELKEFEIHWKVLGIHTFLPLFATYKGYNLTEEEVREHHIRTIVDQHNGEEFMRKRNLIIVPSHVHIHYIKDVTKQE